LSEPKKSKKGRNDKKNSEEMSYPKSSNSAFDIKYPEVVAPLHKAFDYNESEENSKKGRRTRS
jgi:hypothetical protein